jgi:hypothetical protein
MIANRFGVSGLAAVLAVTIAAPAVAAVPFYRAAIIGKVVDANLNETDFAQGSQPPEAVPIELGRTATDWQVGANATAAHGGTVESNIQMGPIPRASGGGYAELLTSMTTEIYSITLDGTGSDAFVPVTIGAKGTVDWSQSGLADATFSFEGPTSRLIFNEIEDTSAPQGTNSFTVNQLVDLIPGQTYTIVMTTFAQADINNLAPDPSDPTGQTIPFGMDSAVVDPTFTIDPAFAGRWSIDGIPVDTTTTTGGGVPEPATWAMLVAGFGLAGASLRRRRALSIS